MGQSRAKQAYAPHMLGPVQHEQPRAGNFQKPLGAPHDTHRSDQYRTIALQDKG
jgi:hypothetical protein